jgi:1-acyl-sn-glycerol-3-phosphate acyltransferase
MQTYRTLRTFVVVPAIGIMTIVFSISVLLHMGLFRSPEVFYLYARSWSKLLLWLAGVRVHVDGAMMLHQTTRYVFTANHASLFDIPVLLVALPQNIRIMYKKELERIPIFGWCLRMSPFIAIERAHARKAATVVDDTIASMRQGASVLVFPEGTRSISGIVSPFKRGAFLLAIRAQKPIVPVAVVGTHAIMPAQTKTIVPGDVYVSIHPPIPTDRVVSKVDELQVLHMVEQIISEAVNSSHE